MKPNNDSLQLSCAWWNMDRVSFLLERCNIPAKALLKRLGLEESITVRQLKQFTKDGSGLSEDLLWSLHYGINGFFRG